MRHFLAIIVLLAGCCLPARAERATEGGPTHKDGTEVICDLPLSHWIKNVGGRDGAGLCVFTSINMAAYWQNCEPLFNFQKQMRTEPGGGYPEKVDRMMRKYAPSTTYVQYSGDNPAILDLAIKTGRMPSVTYGYSERYGGRVAHMVNLVHIDERIACVLDNNFIGAERLEWMSRGEFLRRWKLGGGGWTVILLNPPPPPIPVNVAPAECHPGEIPGIAGLCGQLVYGAWGPSDCGPVGPDAMPSSLRRSRLSTVIDRKEPRAQQPPVPAHIIAPDCEWRIRVDDPDRFYLYRAGVQVGGWDGNDKRWMDYDASCDQWENGYPPWYVDSFSREGKKQAVQVFFGVDRHRVPQQETFSINGHNVDVRVGRQAFGDDSLSDDSGKPRITLSGPKDIRDRVLSDLKSHPALAQLSSKFLVQSYESDAWPMAVFKRPAGDGFYLSVTGPPDKRQRAVECHNQIAYEGPEKLAEALQESLRRVDPSYQPDKTPDLTKPKPTPTPSAPADYSEFLWMVLAALAAFILGGKRNANPQ